MDEKEDGRLQREELVQKIEQMKEDFENKKDLLVFKLNEEKQKILKEKENLISKKEEETKKMIETFKEELLLKESTIMNLKNIIEETKENKKHTKKIVENLQEKIETLENFLNKNSMNYEEKLKEMEEKNENLKTTMKDIEQKYEEKQIAANELEEKLNRKQEECENLNESFYEMKLKNENLFEDLNNLQQKLSMLLENEKSNESLINEVKEELHKLKAIKEEKEFEIEQLNQKIQEYDTKYTILLNEQKEYEENYNLKERTLMNQINSQIHTINDLKDKLEEKELHLVQQEKEFNDQHVEIEKQLQRNEKLNEKVVDLKKELQDKLSEYHSELEHKSSVIQTQLQNIEELNTINQSLRRDISDERYNSNEEINKLKVEMEALKTKIQENNENLEIERSNLLKLKNELEDELKLVKSQNKDLENVVSTSKLQIDELQREIETKDRLFQQQSDQLNDMRQEINHQLDIINELNRKNSDLTMNINNLQDLAKQEKESLTLKINNLQNDYKAVVSKNEILLKENDSLKHSTENEINNLTKQLQENKKVIDEKERLLYENMKHMEMEKSKFIGERVMFTTSIHEYQLNIDKLKEELKRNQEDSMHKNQQTNKLLDELYEKIETMNQQLKKQKSEASDEKDFLEMKYKELDEKYKNNLSILEVRQSEEMKSFNSQLNQLQLENQKLKQIKMNPPDMNDSSKIELERKIESLQYENRQLKKNIEQLKTKPVVNETPNEIYSAPLNLYKNEKNTLITIPFSHYNEKARWALDLFNIEYEEKSYLPGFHVPVVLAKSRFIGSKDSVSSKFSTPLLLTKSDLLHDSSSILHYVSGKYENLSSKTPKLFPNQLSHELMNRFSLKLGSHSRKIAYYYLFKNDELFHQLIAENSSELQSKLLKPFTGYLKQYILNSLNIKKETIHKSIQIVKDEFKFVDYLLSDGRSYLTGNQFTAADLTFASLGSIAILVSNAEGYSAKLPCIEEVHEEYRSLVYELRKTKAGEFIIKMFKNERKPNYKIKSSL